MSQKNGMMVRLTSPLQTIWEFVRLAKGGGRGWLIPMFALMILVAMVLVVVSVMEYVAPFVYTIF